MKTDLPQRKKKMQTDQKLKEEKVNANKKLIWLYMVNVKFQPKQASMRQGDKEIEPNNFLHLLIFFHIAVTIIIHIGLMQLHQSRHRDHYIFDHAF